MVVVGFQALGIEALADQQLAAGIMWGPGSIPYALFVFVALYRWLAPGGDNEARPSRLNGRDRRVPRVTTTTSTR